MSLLVSYTLAPTLGSLFLQAGAFQKSISGFIFGNFEKGVRRLSNAYGGWVAWALMEQNHHLLVITGLFFSSFMLVTMATSARRLSNSGDRANSSSNLSSQKMLPSLKPTRLHKPQRFCLSKPEVTGFSPRWPPVRIAEWWAKSPGNLAEMTVKLVDRKCGNKPTSTFAVQIRERIGSHPSGRKWPPPK